MALDTSPTTQDALSLIAQNYNAGLALDLQVNDVDYVFEAPATNTDVGQNRNTRIYVRPIAISGKYGRITIYYNRIDLGAITDIPTVTLGAALRVADIIPLLNDYFGINLVANDYIDADLSQGDAVILANANSLMFIGGLRIKVMAEGVLGIAPTPVVP